MATISEEAFEAASRRAAQRLKKTPVAVSARYEPGIGRVVISLSSGLDLSFRPQNVQGLETTRSEDLREIEISLSGLGLHFTRTGVDLNIPGLIEGFLGSRKWMAAQMGAVGGMRYAVFAGSTIIGYRTSGPVRSLRGKDHDGH